jgi:hypothetical protein
MVPNPHPKQKRLGWGTFESHPGPYTADKSVRLTRFVLWVGIFRLRAQDDKFAGKGARSYTPVVYERKSRFLDTLSASPASGSE